MIRYKSNVILRHLAVILLFLAVLLVVISIVRSDKRKSVADYYSYHGAPLAIAESAYITQSQGLEILNIIQFTTSISMPAMTSIDSGILIYSDSHEIQHYIELCANTPNESSRFVALFPSPQPRVKLVEIVDGTVVRESRVGISCLYLKPKSAARMP